MFFYTAFCGKIGIISYFDADNSNSISWHIDVHAAFVDYRLDRINCKDMVIILQPSYPDYWIYYLKNDENRVIFTSERSGQPAEFDKCNKESGVGSSKWYVEYSTVAEKEIFQPSSPPPS